MQSFQLTMYIMYLTQELVQPQWSGNFHVNVQFQVKVPFNLSNGQQKGQAQ